MSICRWVNHVTLKDFTDLRKWDRISSTGQFIQKGDATAVTSKTRTAAFYALRILATVTVVPMATLLAVRAIKHIQAKPLPVAPGAAEVSGEASDVDEASDADEDPSEAPEAGEAPNEVPPVNPQSLGTKVFTQNGQTYQLELSAQGFDSNRKDRYFEGSNQHGDRMRVYAKDIKEIDPNDLDLD